MNLRPKLEITQLSSENVSQGNGPENLTSYPEIKDFIQEFLKNNEQNEASFRKDQTLIKLKKNPKTIQAKVSIPLIGEMTADFDKINKSSEQKLTADELSEGIKKLIGMSMPTTPESIESNNTIEEDHRHELSNFHQAKTKKSA